MSQPDPAALSGCSSSFVSSGSRLGRQGGISALHHCGESWWLSDLRLDVLGWLKSFPWHSQTLPWPGAQFVQKEIAVTIQGEFQHHPILQLSHAGFLVGARQNQGWILAGSALPGQVWMPQSWCSPSEILSPGVYQGLLPFAPFGYNIQRIFSISEPVTVNSPSVLSDCVL